LKGARRKRVALRLASPLPQKKKKKKRKKKRGKKVGLRIPSERPIELIDIVKATRQRSLMVWRVPFRSRLCHQEREKVAKGPPKKKNCSKLVEEKKFNGTAFSRKKAQERRTCTSYADECGSDQGLYDTAF